MKPMRTFGVLERMNVQDFDLAKDRVGRWTLQLDGKAFFHLPLGIVKATADFTEEEVAAMLFDTILDYRNAAVSTGYQYGKEALRTEIKTLLGMNPWPL